MTEKRFTKRFFINGEIGITDKEAKKTPQIFFAYSNKEANKMCKTLNALNDENEELKQTNQKLYDDLQTCMSYKSLKMGENSILKKENEQLKQRNKRQAKHLAELYELMAKKDWESLTEIIDDFCSCEEQLQREWKCYE